MVQNERECAAKMAEILKENVKQIKIAKLEAKLCKAQNELAEKEQKAAKTKADKKAAKKSKAA